MTSGVGFIICSILTIIIFGLEIIFAWFEKQKYRKIVKPFCLIGLMLTLFCYGVHNWLILLALGFGLLGDIVLIWPEKKLMFLLGTAFFFVNHVINIYLLSTLLSYQVPFWAIFGLCMFGILFPLLGYRLMYKHTGILTIPGLLYFYILFMELLFAVLVLKDTLSPCAILILVGNLFFIGSDTTLSLSHFVIEIKRRDFYIMLTYLIAQTLIAFGLCLMI